VVVEIDMEIEAVLLQVDFTLSFLDSYVSAALESGAEPYRPRAIHRSGGIEGFMLIAI